MRIKNSFEIPAAGEPSARALGGAGFLQQNMASANSLAGIGLNSPPFHRVLFSGGKGNSSDFAR